VLVEGTVRGAVSNAVQAFRTAGRQNPTKDDDHKLGILLSRQFRAYKNDDPQQKQQKALPFIVLDKPAKQQVTDLDIALSQLTIGAAFFACRSCKYLIVPKTEEQRTKLLCLKNIRFFKDGHLISAPLASLELIDSVAITFEMQKNDNKFETVIRGRTDDPFLYPVLQWARLANCIWSYEGTTQDTPVCTFQSRGGRLDTIASSQVLMRLQTAAQSVGSASLGFKPKERALPTFGSSNGDVPGRGTGLYPYANRQMVKRCIFVLHSEAGGAVLASCRETDAHFYYG
jgi:hypothetical protein